MARLLIRYSLLSFAFTITTGVSVGQIRDVENQTLLSVFDGNRFYELFNFLVERGDLEAGQDSSTILFERNLFLDSLGCRVYKFGVPSSHLVSYLYFTDLNGHRKYINDYSVKAVLRDLSLFFQANKDCFFEDNRILWMGQIAEFLKYRRLADLDAGYTTVIEKN